MNQVVNFPTKPKEQFVPWEGLGAKINVKDSLQTTMKNAGLNWKAKRSPVLYSVADTVIKGTSDVIYRSDNNYQLGIVSDKYKIVQPEAVVGLYKELVDLTGWKLDVLGSLDGGRRLWALAKTDMSFFAGDDEEDIIDIHLLLTTTFDGSSSTLGKFVSFRNICGNSISLAVGENSSLGKVTLNHKAEFDPKKLKEKLKVLPKASEIFERQVELLCKKQISDEQAVRFLIDTLEKEGADPDHLSARQVNIIAKVFDLYKGKGMGSTFKSSRGSAWGLLNAITQHIDYNVGRNDNNRIRAAWFGIGETLKIKAMDKLLNL